MFESSKLRFGYFSTGTSVLLFYPLFYKTRQLLSLTLTVSSRGWSRHAACRIEAHGACSRHTFQWIYRF